MKPKIAIGSDHAGYALKQILLEQLQGEGYEVKDFGTYSEASVDYPDFARKVAEAVSVGFHDQGVLVCGSGQGVCITANKVDGIRAGVAWNEEMGRLLRQHNDANVICFAGRFTAGHHAISILDAYLAAEFEGGNHLRRVQAIEL